MKSQKKNLDQKQARAPETAALVETAGADAEIVLRDIDSKDPVERIRHFSRLAESFARVSVQAAVVTGYELLKAQTTCARGTFTAFVEKCGIVRGSAYRYMALAQKALNLDGDKGLLAAEATPIEAIEAGCKELDGRTLTQLYLDFGIVKKSAECGGARPGAGRHAKDLKAQIDALAKDPGIVSGELNRVMGELMEFVDDGKDRLGVVPDHVLEAVVAELGRVEKRVTELLTAHRKAAKTSR